MIARWVAQHVKPSLSRSSATVSLLRWDAWVEITEEGREGVKRDKPPGSDPAGRRRDRAVWDLGDFSVRRLVYVHLVLVFAPNNELLANPEPGS